MIFVLKTSLTTMWGINYEGENWKGRLLDQSREDSDVDLAASRGGGEKVSGCWGYLMGKPIGFNTF